MIVTSDQIGEQIIYFKNCEINQDLSLLLAGRSMVIFDNCSVSGVIKFHLSVKVKPIIVTKKEEKSVMTESKIVNNKSLNNSNYENFKSNDKSSNNNSSNMIIIGLVMVAVVSGIFFFGSTNNKKINLNNYK